MIWMEKMLGGHIVPPAPVVSFPKVVSFYENRYGSVTNNLQ